ncbi:ABC transporter permease [Chryseolinea sp. T2]|uniref:ABC transporter permease n=1 Tax=Chryseolinea sp. T2 TaxID=3129255 RepID=UPI003078732C
MKHQPPKLARKIFEWYCGHARVDDLLGDIDELFFLNLKNKPAFVSKWIYWKQICSLLFSYAVKRRKNQAQVSAFASSSFSPAMVNSYFKIAARNLYKHRYFSVVNVLGLAVGMSVSLLLIVLYLHVCTYDTFHVNKSEIHRVITTHSNNKGEWQLAAAPFSIADDLEHGFAGVKRIVRIRTGFNADVVASSLDLPMRGLYTDPAYFEVFTFPMISGNPSTALSKPNSVVITESTAKKIFNSADVLGKTFELKNVKRTRDTVAIYEITGVMADPPPNSHMAFEVLVSLSTLQAEQQTYTGDFKNVRSYGNQYVYVLLDDNLVLPKLQARLDELSEASGKRAEAKIKFHLQALADIVPGVDLSSLGGSLGPEWANEGFIVFGVICLMILLPACFNYTNISIARALKRSKEIGLRKTMGGLRNQIFFQFITETILITSVSVLVGLVMFYFVRQEFRDMMISGNALDESMFVNGSALDLSLTWPMAFAFVVFALFTGLVAGFVPALYFAGLSPIQALRNQTHKHSSQGRIRKGLTVFQFALSFCFIIGLIVFSRQYSYNLNYDFGFQRENILNVTLQGVNPEQFRNQFSQLASVQNMSMSSHVLGVSTGVQSAASIDSGDSSDVHQIFADHNYIDVVKLELLTGKNFPNEIWQGEKYMIVNEEFVKRFKLGTPYDALGKLFRIENKELEIIGVLKNFNYRSLRKPIEAFMIRTDPNQYQLANLSVGITDSYKSLSQMENAWKVIEPDKKFEAGFFDDKIRDSYGFYKTFLKLVGYLGILAISISLLGLLGMVVYTSETRTKEVGIRKVMGATTGSITLLLSKDYLTLLMWAAVFAIPVTVWLAGMIFPALQAYHVTLNFWDVLISLAILLTMGLATIVSQTFKTASTNPAETLRTD